MQVPIALNLPDQQAVDPLGQSLENVVLSPFGVKQRFGSALFFDTTSGAGIDGLYNWSEHSLIVVVSGGKVYKVTDTAFSNDQGALLLEDGSYFLLEDGYKLLLEAPAALTEVTGATAMATNKRVIFANYGEYLYMANGGKIQELRYEQSFVSHGTPSHNYSCKLNHLGASTNEPGVGVNTATYWTDLGVGSDYDAWMADLYYGSGEAEVLADLSAPDTVSWVGIADYYLLAIEDGTEFLWYSVVGEPYDWDSDWTTASFLPDATTCLRVVNGDVYVGGPRSIEVFQNDGITPWVTSNYGAISQGVMAPYTFVFCDSLNTFVWLDENRRLVRLNGRNTASLNPSLDTYLLQIPYIIDAIADFVVMEGVPYYYLQFPTSEMGVMVNLSDMSWSEFHGGGSRWEAWVLCNIPKWSTTLLGDGSGILRYMSTNYDTDSGNTIMSVIRTPRLQVYGVTTAPELVLHLTKVAKTPSVSPSTLTVRWRDDDKDWVTARTVTISDDSKTDVVKHLYRLGSYRFYRQYEFNLSSLWPYALTKVEQR
jgi:hypothetical protein